MIAVAGLVLDASEDSLEPDACLVDVGPKLAFCHSTLVSRHSTANCYHSIFSVDGPWRFMPSWRLNKSRARAWHDTEDHDHAAFEATRP